MAANMLETFWPNDPISEYSNILAPKLRAAITELKFMSWITRFFYYVFGWARGDVVYVMMEEQVIDLSECASVRNVFMSMNV